MQITDLNTVTERKIISISNKRQVTIPQKYFDALGFNNEAECVLQANGIMIRPLRDNTGYFSEQILADLIAEGFGGDDLLEKFKERSRAIRPAVIKLLEETDAYAKSGEGRISMNELFGSEDE